MFVEIDGEEAALLHIKVVSPFALYSWFSLVVFSSF